MDDRDIENPMVLPKRGLPEMMDDTVNCPDCNEEMWFITEDRGRRKGWRCVGCKRTFWED